jgi:F0F1-type ATP synthase epsilon subunit
MREGEVKVTLPGGAERRFRIAGGILRVSHNSAVLLAESVEEISA